MIEYTHIVQTVFNPLKEAKIYNYLVNKSVHKINIGDYVIVYSDFSSFGLTLAQVKNIIPRNEYKLKKGVKYKNILGVCSIKIDN